MLSNCPLPRIPFSLDIQLFSVCSNRFKLFEWKLHWGCCLTIWIKATLRLLLISKLCINSRSDLILKNLFCLAFFRHLNLSNFNFMCQLFWSNFVREKLPPPPPLPKQIWQEFWKNTRLTNYPSRQHFLLTLNRIFTQ